jgi:hypothetical protein
MISIDAYRARIGSFRNGRIKQKGSNPNFDDIFSMKKEKYFPRVILTQKQSCFIFLCVLGLMSLLCFEVKKAGRIEGTPTNITCTNGIISNGPTQPTSSQLFCHTDRKESGMSSLNFCFSSGYRVIDRQH